METVNLASGICTQYQDQSPIARAVAETSRVTQQVALASPAAVQVALASTINLE